MSSMNLATTKFLKWSKFYTEVALLNNYPLMLGHAHGGIAV